MSLRIVSVVDISGLNVATLLPPELLADRVAWSTRRRRSDVLSWPGRPVATPRLTVRLSISPSMAICLWTRPCSVCANASAAGTSMAAAGTTTNSSPPKRATTEGYPRWPAQQRGEGLDEPVAGVLAEAIVDDLEAVRARNTTATGPGCPSASRSSRYAMSALRLRSPVSSSCSAR